MVDAMARHPSASFPTQMGSESELEAAYRFLSGSSIKHDELLEPHRQLTARRAEAMEEVVVIHDTSTFEFAHADPREVGFLPTGKAGFFGHFSFVVSADGQRRPLGMAALQPIFRARQSGRGSRKRHVSGAETATWADRESLRWAAGVVASEELLASCPARIHVADREADSFALFALMIERDCRFVVRLHHDRRAREVGSEEPQWSNLKTLAGAAEHCLVREVPLSPRRGGVSTPKQKRATPSRKARLATLQFSVTRVELRRPSNVVDSAPKTLSVNVVRVFELNTLDGEQPVEWLLVTTEPVGTPEKIERVVDLYRTRWVIEEFFKALKTGCAYEDRELESRRALLNALALMTPIACQLLWLRSRAQHAPDVPARDVITDRQLRVLRAFHRKPLPEQASARDVLLAIAELGGHVSNNGEPGWSSTWLGLQRLLDFERGWIAARSKRIL
jgi:hypothetical protein